MYIVIIKSILETKCVSSWNPFKYVAFQWKCVFFFLSFKIFSDGIFVLFYLLRNISNEQRAMSVFVLFYIFCLKLFSVEQTMFVAKRHWKYEWQVLCIDCNGIGIKWFNDLCNKMKEKNGKKQKSVCEYNKRRRTFLFPLIVSS